MGSHYWNQVGGGEGEQFPKTEPIIPSGQLTFWLVETIFSLFFGDSCQWSFFSRLVETMFQENPSFRLVEMDCWANNGLRKKKEKL